MTINSVDLQGLDDFNPSSLLGEEDKKNRYEIDIKLISEDPHQPRKTMSEEGLNQLVDSINAPKVDGSKTGIISPISVRDDEDAIGRYIINYGHRRFRAAIKAGLVKIPAVVDNTQDVYSQLIENIQREDLSPLEIAQSISEMVNNGVSKGQIAKSIGKPASYVSDHIVLSDLTPEVKELLETGICKSVQAIASLQRAFNKTDADEVISFCKTAQNSVTLKDVKKFLTDLKTKAEVATSSTDTIQIGEDDNANKDENTNLETGTKEEVVTSSTNTIQIGEDDNANKDENTNLETGTKEEVVTSSTNTIQIGEDDNANEDKNTNLETGTITILNESDGKKGILLSEQSDSPNRVWVLYNGQTRLSLIDLTVTKIVVTSIAI
jgi:ParB family chromosome partitioning protein